MGRLHTNRLVDIAAVILDEIGRPASAREIVERARTDPRFSDIIGGKTPHKTLNARISTDIIERGDRSPFFRYAPAAYGLRERLHGGAYASGYRTVFLGRQRRKEVSNEDVAVIDAHKLSFFKTDGFYDCKQYPLSILSLLDINYMPRKQAEACHDVKQLVSYAAINHGDAVLAFERGKYTSDNGEFVGKHSIGFGGHLNQTDLSLFDETPVGLYSNIHRELHEELYIFRKELRHLVSSVTFFGYLVDSSTNNGRKHIGLAALIDLKERIEIETPTLGIRNLRWISRRHTPNSFSQFEIWSQYLFRHLQGLSAI